MGLFRQAVQKSATTNNLGHSIGSSSAVSLLMGTGAAKINVLKEYQGYAWKVINIRAQTLSAEDLFVEQLVGKQWQSAPTHVFNDVLEGDNTTRDLSELLEAHSRYKDLYGESFWYFATGEKYGLPMGVYLLDPRFVTVMIANERVTGYVYQNGEQYAALDTDEVVHCRIEDPSYPYRGYGPMQAAGWFVRSARYTTTYVNNFLENNAIPAGVVVAKEANDTDWELFKHQWTDNYGGVDKAGKTGFIRGNDIDFIQTGASIADMDFDKLRNSSRDDVMMMFGISKPMAAIFDDINRASATVARQLFGLTFTQPELKSLARKFTKRVRVWYGKQYRISFTNPIPDDPDVKLSQYDKGVGRWFTVNEARAAYGKDPIDGGDVIQPEVKATQSDGTKSFLGHNHIHVVLKSNNNEEFRQSCEDLQIKYENQLIKKLTPVLESQEKKTLSQLKSRTKAAVSPTDPQEVSTEMVQEMLGVMIDLAKQQGIITGDFIDSTFTINDSIVDYIKQSISRSTLSFSQETATAISQAMADGLQAGESIPELKARISGIYSDAKGYRLERIARTETINASNEVTEQTYIQSGVVKAKEWMSNPGACPECAAINGETAELGKDFPGGVQHPGLHPNCRCTILPVIDETKLFHGVAVLKNLASRDIPEISSLEIDTSMLSDDSKRGCIMASTEKFDVLSVVDHAKDDLSDNVTSDRDAVPGETTPHVTLLYGLLNNGNVWKEQVDAVLDGCTLDSVKITEVGFFETPNNNVIVAHIEKTKELVDAHERLTLLPNAQTFSEYSPHISLAYIDKDADVKKWVESLGNEYNGKIVKITGIDYGDNPE